jgi:hypothetical protein
MRSGFSSLTVLLLLFACLRYHAPATEAKTAFASFAGVYSGAVYGGGVGGGSWETTGSLRLVASKLGKGTASLKVGDAAAITAAVSESLAGDGTVSVQLIPKAEVDLTAGLRFIKEKGISKLVGTITTNGTTIPISFQKLVTKAKPQGWTFCMLGPDGTSKVGVGAARIERSGRVIGVARMIGLGQKPFATTVLENGAVPLSVSFHDLSDSTATRLVGDVKFPNGPATLLTGTAAVAVTIAGSPYRHDAPVLGRKSGDIAFEQVWVNTASGSRSYSGGVTYRAPDTFVRGYCEGYLSSEIVRDGEYVPFSVNRKLGVITGGGGFMGGVVDQPNRSVTVLGLTGPVLTGVLRVPMPPRRPGGTTMTSTGYSQTATAGTGGLSPLAAERSGSTARRSRRAAPRYPTPAN